MKEGVMILITGILLAASIGAPLPPTSVGSSDKEVTHITKEMMIGIADDLMKADIAEVDIDPAVFDIPAQSKTRKKSALDEVEFISEADKPVKK
jgi:hypothetical protein